MNTYQEAEDTFREHMISLKAWVATVSTMSEAFINEPCGSVMNQMATDLWCAFINTEEVVKQLEKDTLRLERAKKVEEIQG